MTKREKVLLVLVMYVLGLGLGLKIVRTQVIDRRARLIRTIEDRRKELSRMKARRHLAENVQRRLFDQIALETLSTDPTQARQKMLNEVDALARRHGFKGLTVRPNELRPLKTGILPLTFSVHGEATLNQIVPFLYDLHRLPFMARVESIKLTPTSGKTRENLQMTLKGETIVLPTTELAPVVKTAELDNPRPVNRTKSSELGTYLAMVQKRFFEPYKAPPPPPAPPPTPAPVASRPANHAPPPPVITRQFDPNRTSTRVVALLSSPDMQEVVLMGPDKRRRIVKVGEPFDGGVLAYVHPEGAVVVYKDPGRDTAEKDFYPQNKLMSEMKVLTEEENPEVFHKFSLVEKASQATADIAAGSKGGA